MAAGCSRADSPVSPKSRKSVKNPKKERRQYAPAMQSDFSQFRSDLILLKQLSGSNQVRRLLSSDRQSVGRGVVGGDDVSEIERRGAKSDMPIVVDAGAVIVAEKSAP